MSQSATLAPIVLFCYNRPLHLRQTVESLQRNDQAAESDLIIYSDGPKTAQDHTSIAEIRGYITHIKGFKSVQVIASEQNNGLAASVIKGVSEVLEHYKRVIVLEDDMLCTPDFLTFMNEALDTYSARKDIFSVTAYSPPIHIPDNYKNDLFLAPRASSWGWGTWLDKWNKADWEVIDFTQLKQDKAQIAEFTKGGEDLWPMLVKQQRGVINSWAIRWTYSQFKHHAYGVYPVHSKIKNIGTDGSGTNFTFKTGYYGEEMNPEKIRVDADIQPDPEIMESFRGYYHLPIQVKIKNWIKYQI